MTEINEKVLERLEAEATVADAEAEELTIAVESDIENKDEQIEELQSEVDSKGDEVEELQSELSEKEAEVENMSEKIDTVKETYAEELSKRSDVLDKEDFLGKFDFDELQAKYENIEEKPSEPAPNSGDPGAGFQSPDDDGDGTPDEEPEELSKKAQVASEQFRVRGGVWNDIADDIEENGLGEVRKRDKTDEVFA